MQPHNAAMEQKFSYLQVRILGRWFFLSILVGVAAGLGAIAFHILCLSGEHYILGAVANYYPGGPDHEQSIFEPHDGPSDPIAFWLILLPAAGGLLSGLLVYTLAPEAEGHGTDAAIRAYHHDRGRIRARVPIVKTIASAITLGSGGSGGREGPIAQIGAGFGSFMATRLRLSDRDRRILLAAGVGAGIAAIFRAPLAGAIFAVEVMYRDPEFESEALIPAMISTIVAYCVFGYPFGYDTLFDTPDVRFDNPLLLVPLSVLALVCVGGAAIYVRTFYGVHALAQRLSGPRFLRPVLGGLLTGLLAVVLWRMVGDSKVLGVMSFGYGALQEMMKFTPIGAVDGQFSKHIMLLAVPLLVLAGGKILTTSFTISSGGSGGVFGPSMVIGGALGGAVGLIFYSIPQTRAVCSEPAVFVLLGMAGFFSAVANAPISTLIMVSEMTGSYKLLLPSMWVCAVCYVLGRRWSIYREQVRTRADSPVHRGDFIIDVLEGIKVRDLDDKIRRNTTTVPADATLSEISRLITRTEQHYFPVVRRDGALSGIISIGDVRAFLYDEFAGETAIAQDVATTDLIVVHPNEDLNSVMQKFTVKNLDELPVMEDGSTSCMIGMLSRREALAAYNRRLLERKQPEEESQAI